MAHTKLHTVISDTVYILRPGQLFRALSPSSASHWLCVDFDRHWTPTRNHSSLFWHSLCDKCWWSSRKFRAFAIRCWRSSSKVKLYPKIPRAYSNVPRMCLKSQKGHSVTRTVRLDHWLGQFKPGLGPNISEETKHQASRFRKIIQKKECCWWNNARYKQKSWYWQNKFFCNHNQIQLLHGVNSQNDKI